MRSALLWAAIAGTAPAPVPEILVTRQLREAEGLRVGDIVELAPGPDGTGARAFRIAGTYEPTADPRRLTATRHEARLHLEDLLALTCDPRAPEARETVDHINLLVRDPGDTQALERGLRGRAPELRLVANRGDRDAESFFVVLERFHVAISVVTVLGSSAFLMALMLMRAEERREVAGTLRLLGFTRRRILAQVLLEGGLLATAGALFGVLSAGAIQGLVNAFFQRHYDTALVFVRVTPAIAARSLAIAVPLGVGAGLLASARLLARDIGRLLGR